VTMGRQSIWEYLRAVYGRYRRAERRAKQTMLGGVCAKHALSPQTRPAGAEWAAPQSSPAPPRAPRAPPPPPSGGGGVGAEGHRAGGGLSLVGAAEGPDRLVDALGAKTFSSPRRAGAPTAGHQRPPKRPPAASLQSVRPATPLRRHPAGSSGNSG